MSARARDLARGSVPVSTSLVAAAAASAGAGLVHAAAAGSHSGEPALGWLFALCAILQLGWAGLVVVQPRRAVVAGGVLFNAGGIVVWALTRTMRVGGPFGDVQPVGYPDLLAASFAAVVVVGGCLALAVRSHASRRLDVAVAGLASVTVLALAVPAMAVGHTHSDEHPQDSGDVAIADDGAASTDGVAQDHEATTVDATGPIVSLDDPRLTKEQRARAQKLLGGTRAALRSFPDEAAVVAAGYTSIGDGRRVGRFEHFVNRAYIVDGRELDPSAIESIVLQRQADGTKKVVSAMYILGPGKTMADAPDIAGELTPWHDHQNLCWDETGTRLAGVLVNGVCVPGGTFRGTSPMMHVWLEDTPCGPFAGIEGHGGACLHDHAS